MMRSRGFSNLRFDTIVQCHLYCYAFDEFILAIFIHKNSEQFLHLLGLGLDDVLIWINFAIALC